MRKMSNSKGYGKLSFASRSSELVKSPRYRQGYAPAAQRTRYINVEHKRPRSHEYNLVEVRRERLLGKIDAASTRTVEVTIPIALDSYRILATNIKPTH